MPSAFAESESWRMHAMSRKSERDGPNRWETQSMVKNTGAARYSAVSGAFPIALSGWIG